MITRFYHQLKNEYRDDNQIIYLAKNLDLDESFSNVDPLTFAIFHEHKAAFHILINRGINPNPPQFKDIPPLLWTLEVSNTYFFEQLIKRTNVNLFHIEPKHHENLLANMCLKLNDICLFRRTFKIMKNKNEEFVKNLILIRVLVDTQRIFPLEICIHKLNKMILNGSSESDEKICLAKIQTILDFYPRGLLNPFRILDCILNYPGILENNTCFLQLLMGYLDKKYYLQQYQNNIYNLYEKSITEKGYILTQLLKKFVVLDKDKQLKCFNLAVSVENLEVIAEFLLQGFDVKQVQSPYFMLELAIKEDNLILYQHMTSSYTLKYKIWHHKVSVNINSGNIELPKYHRALHMACIYQASNIIQYLQETVGDSIHYKGLCAISPYELLKEGVEQYYIPDIYLNELIAPKIQWIDFIKNDTLSQKECPICLDDFYNQEIVILECGHAFHKCCLQTHIKNSNQCPYCRAEIIHKYKCQAKLGLLLPKKKTTIIEEKSYSKIYHTLQDTYKIKKYSYTYEDKDNYHILVGKVMETFEEQLQKSKHKYFQKKISILENNIKINKLRFMLNSRDIGKPRKNKKFIPKYNPDFQGYRVPPNSPVLTSKKQMTPEDLLRKYDIDINNIMTGKRKNRNVRPDYYIDTC